MDREYLPIIGKHFRDGTFPMHLIPRLAELGVLGANLHGLRLRGDEQRHLRPHPPGAGAGDSGLRSFASVQGSLCMYPIHAFG